MLVLRELSRTAAKFFQGQRGAAKEENSEKTYWDKDYIVSGYFIVYFYYVWDM